MALPLVLAGRQLRRLEAQRLVMWLATSCEVRLRMRLTDGDAIVATCDLATAGAAIRRLSAGERLHYYLLDLSFGQPLHEGRWVGYELELARRFDAEPRWQGWRECAPDLCYPGRQGPGFSSLGNRPEAVADDLLSRTESSLQAPGGTQHGALIGELLRFGQWHYEWPTTPALLVLDTRTQRWRSEPSARRPSGLMD
ncbi:MAG: hypothetical protein KDH17_07065 [Rhodocyclaceae bacterium]|nr:hypothetical protein [Rhodocyclaceae bacterium]